jgi:hypothetical protein
MFKEHEVVTLTSSILEGILHIPPASPNARRELLPGDVGTIVHIYPGGETLTVEFHGPDVYTAAIADVLATQIRPATEDDLVNDRFFPATEEQIANFRSWKKPRL